MFAGVDISTWVILVLTGCVSGFASGLLGIGGGTIIVPAMVFILPLFGVGGPELPKIAMATALALVIPTTVSGTASHASRGAVDWGLLLFIAPSLMAGAYLSSSYISFVPTSLLVGAFVTFAAYSAWKLILPAPKRMGAGDQETPNVWLLLKTFTGGAASSLLGFGVGYFAVPLLSRFIPIQRAIGTASALAIPMAMSGVIGYLIAGSPEGCHARCTGYVFFPAVLAVGVSAVLVAPVGAWVSHVMPLVVVRRVFAGFLIFAAGNMAYKALPEHPWDAMLATAKDAADTAKWSPVAAQAPQWIGDETKAPDVVSSGGSVAAIPRTGSVAADAPQAGTSATSHVLPYEAGSGASSQKAAQGMHATVFQPRRARQPIATPVEDDPALAASALTQFYFVPTMPGVHLWVASKYRKTAASDDGVESERKEVDAVEAEQPRRASRSARARRFARRMWAARRARQLY